MEMVMFDLCLVGFVFMGDLFLMDGEYVRSIVMLCGCIVCWRFVVMGY